MMVPHKRLGQALLPVVGGAGVSLDPHRLPFRANSEPIHHALFAFALREAGNQRG